MDERSAPVASTPPEPPPPAPLAQPDGPPGPSPAAMQARDLAERVQREVARAVVGMERVVETCLVGVLAGGHLLLEGPPGVAKTLLVRTLASALGGSFGRIQFTPDLMPADITGTSIYRANEGSFRFAPGPVFAHLLLADEINRAPAKTQAALLEAMQECAVTVDGTRHPLPAPFVVFGTMNPIEHEGTYPLPEAQLDRFLFKVVLAYPPAEIEARMLEAAHRRSPLAAPSELGVQCVSSPQELLELRRQVLAVDVRADLPAYVVNLLAATRGHSQLVVGGSPRAGVMLLLAAKARALLAGRDYVVPDDVKASFLPALRHRVVLDPAVEIEGGTSDEALQRILDLVQVPR